MAAYSQSLPEAGPSSRPFNYYATTEQWSPTGTRQSEDDEDDEDSRKRPKLSPSDGKVKATRGSKACLPVSPFQPFSTLISSSV